MRLKSHFQHAFINFTAAKLRALLAMLGILVGTAAVVALLSCGRLATDKALSEFKTMGTDLLAVMVYQAKQSDPNHPSHNRMTSEAWYQLPKQVPAIKKIAPYATVYQTLSYKGHRLDGAVIAADETLAQIIQIQMAQGFFVSFVESFEHFCVIGEKLAEQIRESTLDSPLGKQIQIGQNLYTIIGIAAHWQENAFFNEDINRAVITPIAGIELLSRENSINNAVISLYPEFPIDTTLDQIKAAIVKLAPEQLLFIRSAKQMIASMESQGRIFTLLLTVIGSISLLVGGIGIMNVMLVSVSERKKEIGIRKAVGATCRDIQRLFLAESILLSISGGILGVVLGELLTWIIAQFSDWPYTFYFMPPMAGFAVSAAAGIFFGYYPAKRAAHLDPIACLRSE
ncbi:MAG: ABC transporter permease [Legionellales bacterium RIFCSPHIGHO2_12_FULL_42_9]|nr:MAG: ABC transporter permease [Legionellales bacterium RIFCSPHIGHO2_12_FULL_42_9]